MGAGGNLYFGILTFVSAGGHGVSKAQMIKKYGAALTEEVIAIGAVKEIPDRDRNDVICVITEYGRQRRDQ